MLIQTLIVGCAGIETPTSTTVENEHLIQPEGKFDTGYYSNLAMELEGDFESTLTLEITNLSAADREKLKDQTILGLIAERQVKMAKSQLNEKKKTHKE